jgi:hypothetical protein
MGGRMGSLLSPMMRRNHWTSQRNTLIQSKRAVQACGLAVRCEPRGELMAVPNDQRPIEALLLL